MTEQIDPDSYWKNTFEEPYSRPCVDCGKAIFTDALKDRCLLHEVQFQNYLGAEFWEVFAHDAQRLEAHDIADCRWIGAR